MNVYVHGALQITGVPPRVYSYLTPSTSKRFLKVNECIYLFHMGLLLGNLKTHTQLHHFNRKQMMGIIMLTFVPHS